MRLARSDWPRALLILWAPVWRRSSRLSQTSEPAASDRRRARYRGVGRPGQPRGRGGWIQGGRRAGVVAEQGGELAGERRVRPRLEPGALQLVERRDQRLRHIAAAVGAEATLDRRGAHTGASTWFTAWKKASSRRGSLRPGAASVPLAVSTANG